MCVCWQCTWTPPARWCQKSTLSMPLRTSPSTKSFNVYMCSEEIVCGTKKDFPEQVELPMSSTVQSVLCGSRLGTLSNSPNRISIWTAWRVSGRSKIAALLTQIQVAILKRSLQWKVIYYKPHSGPKSRFHGTAWLPHSRAHQTWNSRRSMTQRHDPRANGWEPSRSCGQVTGEQWRRQSWCRAKMQWLPSSFAVTILKDQLLDVSATMHGLQWEADIMQSINHSDNFDKNKVNGGLTPMPARVLRVDRNITSHSKDFFLSATLEIGFKLPWPFRCQRELSWNHNAWWRSISIYAPQFAVALPGFKW